jgi:putative DNA primase/helicase
MVDVAALVAIDGGGRGSSFDPAGWDAADAFSDWGDPDALRETAARLAEPFDQGPNYVSFGPFAMNTGALTVKKEVGRGNSKRTETAWISAPFEVLGACRDPHGQAWGKMLRWRDADGREHVRQVADYDLHGDPAVLCAKLADVGLRIERNGQRDVADYLSVVDARSRVTVVPRTGWHDLNGRASFVLPGETIGGRGSERVILDPTGQGLYEARATIDDWRNGVALLARGQLLPVLAISTALSGPLLYLIGLEGGGVHFFGPSSIGKTTLLSLAASVWGPGGKRGYVRTWRATANGLEGAAAGATDTALILDELGQVEAHELATAVYALANGIGKARAQRDGSLRESRTWRVQTISSGELPINAKLIEECGRKPRAGQLVRMLDIPASRRFGVFDLTGPDGDGASLAKACQTAAASAYGTAGPEFVRRLIAEQVSGEVTRARARKFVSDHSPPGADGQVVRVAERLGIIGVAGELATHFGLTPWRTNEPGEAAAWALEQWIEGRGGTEPAEVRQGIAQVRHFIEAHGDSRFDNLNHPHDLDYPRDERTVRNRAGWRKGDGEFRRWLIPPEVWRIEVCGGLDSISVARELAKRGMLEKGNDGNSKVEKIADTSKRVYVVTPRIFDGASLTSNRADD